MGVLPEESSQLREPQRRDDEEGVLLAARRVLQSRGHLAEPQCCLQLHEGRLTIRGRVPSYYHKQLAQELVRKLRGVEVVTNLLRVDSSDKTGVQRSRRY